MKAAWLRHPLALRLSAAGLGLVFLAAAWGKVADPPGFAQALHGYRLLPEVLLNPVALALPWLEVLAGLALVLGPARRSAALLALGMLAAFMAALGWNLALGNPVDCGCFGASPASLTPDARFADMRLALLRDAGLALLALHVLVASPPGPEPES